MEDSAPVSVRPTTQSDEFVVRRFLPVRIERLLLTRLFDLTTAAVVDDHDSPKANLFSKDVASDSRGAVRKEAA